MKKREVHMCCGQFCSLLACLAVPFLLVLLLIDRSGSEYLQLEVYKGDGEDRTFTMVGAIMANIGIVIGCRLLIVKLNRDQRGELEDEDSVDTGPQWKFAKKMGIHASNNPIS